MLILLPPSEGKTPPRRGGALDLERFSFPTLSAPRAELLDALVRLCTTVRPADQESAATVLGIGRTLTGEVERNAKLATAPCGRADVVYSGVLYEALDLTSLDQAARRRASRRVAIVSGLFGLVTPADRIPAYRLSGDVSLPGLGKVATFWASRLDQAVRDAAGSGLVVDLRSSTYAPFWRPGPDLADRVVTMRVLHEVNGARKVVSHFNKATKGRIVRAVLEDGGSPSTVTAFSTQLKDLGWDVELGSPTRRGTRVDVVVGQL